VKKDGCSDLENAIVDCGCAITTKYDFNTQGAQAAQMDVMKQLMCLSNNNFQEPKDECKELLKNSMENVDTCRKSGDYCASGYRQVIDFPGKTFTTKFDVDEGFCLPKECHPLLTNLQKDIVKLGEPQLLASLDAQVTAREAQVKRNCDENDPVYDPQNCAGVKSELKSDKLAKEHFSTCTDGACTIPFACGKGADAKVKAARSATDSGGGGGGMFWVLAILLVLAIAGGVGGFLFMQNQKKPSSSSDATQVEMGNI